MNLTAPPHVRPLSSSRPKRDKMAVSKVKKTSILTIVTQTYPHRLPPTLRVRGQGFQRLRVLQSLPLTQNNHSPFLHCTSPIPNLLFRIWRVHWPSLVPIFRVSTLRFLTVGRSLEVRGILSCGLSPITTREWLAY